MVDSNESVESYFARASNLTFPEGKYLTAREKETKIVKDGIKHFKRSVLGFWGLKTIMPFDEVAKALYNSGVAETVAEGESLIPRLYNRWLSYGSRYIEFTLVENGYGEEAVKIQCESRGA
ncbi:MAG TPA: hypothetical protein VJH34_00565 [archaeon]|nr:hypothetical protein [archaeon]